jgi:hypothetical protein
VWRSSGLKEILFLAIIPVLCYGKDMSMPCPDRLWRREEGDKRRVLVGRGMLA